MDYAATTYLDPRVKKAMEPYWFRDFGNPSSIYEEGRIARKAITLARVKVASLLNARPSEIIFTCGGTESDNLAILGVARALRQACLPVGRAQGKPHIITSKIEHHAVLHACEMLEKQGFEVSYIDVDKDGILDLKEFKATLRKDTILVSVMYANNEIGTIQPITEIAKIIRGHRKNQTTRQSDNQLPLFHTDAVQAPSYLDLNVLKLGVDLLTLNGSKIYGPKGIGILFKKKDIKIEPLLYGGSQETSIRPGTENVPAIVGFASALELVTKDKEKESKRLQKLRDYFIAGLFQKIPDMVLNGSAMERLPNNVNVSFLGVEGEAIVLYLDAKGISVSTGSACTSDSLEPSHVIMALKRSYEYAHGSVRFTMGHKTTKAELDYVLKVLPGIIKNLRSISALNKNKK